jgi:hypothetical protein
MGQCRKCGSPVEGEIELCPQCAVQSRPVPAARIAPIGLAVAYILLNLAGGASFADLDAPSMGLGGFVTIILTFVLMGTEPVMLAIWAAFGPPPTFRRVMWSSATAVAAAYAVTVRLPFESRPHAETIIAINVLFPGVFLILTLLLMLTGRFTGWRIEHRAAQFKHRSPAASQFGIKDLLLAQMLLAAALGVGRWLWPPSKVTWQDAEEMAITLPLVTMALAIVLLPVVSAFGILLARLCGQRGLTAPLAAVWGIVVLVLAMAAVFTPVGGGCKEGAVRVAYLIALVPLQLGYLVVSLPSAAVLYYGGYRLVRRAGKADAAISRPGAQSLGEP